jgi:MFS family permease
MTMPESDARAGLAREGTAGWRARASRGLAARGIGPAVPALGFTSLLTDVSSEMVVAILPIWLVRELGFGLLQFGAIDGLWRAIAGVLGAVAAIGADRRGRYRLVALLGYGISTASRLVLPFVPGTWAIVTASLCADRVGKGLRTPARDALISFDSTPAARAHAFALHRSLDAVGRLLGPALAFLLLALAPGAFDAVFLVSIAFAFAGMAVLATHVKEVERAPAAPAVAPAAASGGDRRFGWAVLAIALLGVATIGETFLVLALERRGSLSAEYVPLCFTAMALVQVVFAVPFARLAGRIGRKHALLAGHVLLLGAYAALLPAEPWPGEVVACLVATGLYLAASEGLVGTLASLFSSPRRRAVALAVMACAAAGAKLAASLGFGALWEARGLASALQAFAAGACVLVVVAWCLPWSDRTRAGEVAA